MSRTALWVGSKKRRNRENILQVGRDVVTTTVGGKIATDMLTPFPAPGVCKMSDLMGRGFLYTTGIEIEDSTATSSMNQNVAIV